jgi:hypothetical protein
MGRYRVVRYPNSNSWAVELVMGGRSKIVGRLYSAESAAQTEADRLATLDDHKGGFLDA